MLLTFVLDDHVVTLGVDATASLSAILPLLLPSFDLPPNVQLGFFANGQTLTANQSAQDAGLRENDVVQCQPTRSSAPAAAQSQPQSQLQSELGYQFPTGAQMNQLVSTHPEFLQRLRSSDPELALALGVSESAFDSLIARRVEAAQQRSRIAADPFSLEGQALIEEEIRTANISENMEAALEHAPESFARVAMLYVPMLVNGHQLQAFVDSGAQATIMSKKCADRCGISRLIDTRFSGIAQGVGTAKILGRVHSVQVKFGDAYFTSSFTILDQSDSVEFLLGLDQLRKHRAQIDLESNCLKLAGQSVQFLSEAAIESFKPSSEAGSSSNSTSTSAPASASVSSSATSAATSASVAQPTSQSASQSRATGPAAPSNSAPLDPHVESCIASLTDLGFTRAESLESLIAHGHDLERAAAALFLRDSNSNP